VPRVLALTGATGFIGGFLARHLAAAGWRVRALVRSSTPAGVVANLPAEPVFGDLEDVDSLRGLVRGAEAVVHCAGSVRGTGPGAFHRVNADGLARLVEVAALERPTPRFLSLSSLAAREPSLSAYSASKRLGEQALAMKARGMQWLVLRPPAVYGPGERELLPLFEWMARGFAPMLGCAAARISLLYVEDLADAVRCWLDAERRQSGVFALHDGRVGGYSWAEVVDAAESLLGRRIRRVRVPGRLLSLVGGVNLLAARALGYAPMLTPGKVRELRHPNWVCSNEALREVIGWEPRVRLREGLRRTFSWGETARLSAPSATRGRPIDTGREDFHGKL
jgi:nucleoside-diphosphate-sugar epimerase